MISHKIIDPKFTFLLNFTIFYKTFHSSEYLLTALMSFSSSLKAEKKFLNDHFIYPDSIFYAIVINHSTVSGS